MSSPIITIAEEESVKDAVVLMRSKHIRRLVVKKKAGGDKVDLAEVELPTNVIEREATKIICPYCQSQFKDKAEMSKRIDRIRTVRNTGESCVFLLSRALSIMR